MAKYTTHAADEFWTCSLVREAGKGWFVKHSETGKLVPVRFGKAVEIAQTWDRTHGEVFLGREGGDAFDEAITSPR